MPHLSYVGDATIGSETNIGAATVFVNYDGVDKHKTVIGDHVRIGSDSMLVAPVTIGDGAYTAAGLGNYRGCSSWRAWYRQGKAKQYSWLGIKEA